MAAALLLAGCLSWHPGPLPGEPASATFAQVGDTHVHYVDRRPDGPTRGTVVLVHGFGASMVEWALQVPALVEAGYRVVALDLRGHGWSSRPEGDYSIAGQARLVLGLTDVLGVERFDLVGHSWGSAVALDVVRQAPERVRRVALFNGMFFDDQRPALFGWTRAAGLGEVVVGAFYAERADEKLAWAVYDPERMVPEEAVELAEEELGRPGTRAAALAGLRAMDFAELEPSYARVSQPVLLVWGREDPVTPLEYGERLANRLPDARLVIVPQCGHIPMVEVPAVSTRELMAFLAEAEP